MEWVDSGARGSTDTEITYCFGPFELNVDRLELRRGGALVQADALVLRLLACLVQRAGRLVTKDELVADVWERAVADNAITVAMARLRKTLGEQDGQAKFVSTVYGRGYRFSEVVTTQRVLSRNQSVNAPTNEVQAPFVGRDQLLTRLHRALAATRAGQGRACLLMGEPGIGKTRVVEEFERQVSSPLLRTAWGYCREAGDTPPLAPFLRMVRELTAAVGGADEASPEARQKLSEVLRLFDDQRAALPEGATARSDFVGPGRHRGFDALLRALARIAEQTPLVLIFDDLHRADAGSLELLRHLLEEISRTRILVIATLRLDSALSDGELSVVAGHRNCERIALAPLQRAEVASYVAAVLEDPQGQLGQAVYAKSEGNPFFMVELSRELQNAPQPDASALGVNSAALDLIRQRVARLDQEARGVLSAAAVIGRSFELPLLQAICDRDLMALMTSLDEALGAQVVVAAPDSTTGFAFGHELLRAVLYDALPKAERRRWHIRIANALEQRVNNGETVPPSELAHHLYAALPESDLRKTVHFCREAATAASVYGNPDVVRYLRHALEALSLMPNPSARLRTSLLLMSTVYARGCAHSEYLGLLHQALHLARETNDPWSLIRAAYMLNPHPGFKPLPGAHAALSHALELLGEGHMESRALGLASLACTAPVCFDAKQTQPMVAEAVQLARTSGSLLSLSGALLCKLYSEGGRAHTTHAAELLALRAELEHMARLHARVLPVVPGDLALHQSVLALQRGEPEAIRHALDELEVRSRELRHLELTWHGDRWRILTALNTEPSADALSRLENLHSRAQQHTITGYEPLCAFDSQVVFAAFGMARPMDELQHLALAPDPSDPPSIWSLKLRALATAGMTNAAVLSLRLVSARELAELPCDRDYLGTLGHLARASLQLNLRDYMEATYRLLEPYNGLFCAHVSFFSDGPVSLLLGLLASALGRQPEAQRHLEAAIEHSDRARLALRAAEARLAIATMLSQYGSQRRRALTVASEAHDSAQRLGATPIMRDASQLLERLRAV